MTDLNAQILQLDDDLPEYPAFEPGCRRAPRRESNLSQADKELAIMNALRYIPRQHHRRMAEEFAQELITELHVQPPDKKIMENQPGIVIYFVQPGDSQINMGSWW